MARFPWVERIRAIPVPVFGPAPMIMARPVGGILGKIQKSYSRFCVVLVNEVGCSNT